jgi:outer membrane lipoprotein-sorting protein
MSAKEDLKLDKYNLELEAERQASLLGQYSEDLSEAEKDLNRLKNKLNVEESEIAYSVRKEGKTPHGVKATVDAVREYVAIQPEVIELQEKIEDKRYEVNMLKSAISALEHKKSMITNLVKLQIQGYYNANGPGTKADAAGDSIQDQLN